MVLSKQKAANTKNGFKPGKSGNAKKTENAQESQNPRENAPVQNSTEKTAETQIDLPKTRSGVQTHQVEKTNGSYTFFMDSKSHDEELENKLEHLFTKLIRATNNDHLFCGTFSLLLRIIEYIEERIRLCTSTTYPPELSASVLSFSST